MGVNELVSMLIQESCSTTYIPCPYWEMVEIAPLLMGSTHEGQDELFDAYIIYFLSHL